MMQMILSAAIAAALFALFGLIKHRSCTGHCGGCSGAGGRFQEEDHHGS